MLSFLRRSRVHYVLTHNVPIRIAYVRQFWESVTFDCSVTPSVMRARVNDSEFVFTADDLRTILQLGTATEDDGPVEFSANLRMGAFERIGYTENLGKRSYVKSYLYGQ